MSQRILNETKVCIGCVETKSILDFYKSRKDGSYRMSYCIPCANLKSSVYKKQQRLNPEYRRKRTERFREWRYGISESIVNILFDQQEGKCAVCQTPFSKSPHLDHDHETNVIRGLLCTRCNLGIGYFNDSIESLKAAIDYLEKGGTEYKVVMR